MRRWFPWLLTALLGCPASSTKPGQVPEPTSTGALHIELDNPVPQWAKVKIVPRFDPSLDDRESIELTLVLTKPDGSVSTTVRQHELMEAVCTYCLPAGDGDNSCEHSCVYHPLKVPSDIRLDSKDFAAPGTYHLELSGADVGTAAVDLIVLDPEGWQQHELDQMNPTQNRRIARYARACAQVKTRAQSLDLLGLPAPDRESVLTRIDAEEARSGPGGSIVIRRVFRSSTSKKQQSMLVKLARGQPDLPLTREDQLVQQWTIVGQNIAFTDNTSKRWGVRLDGSKLAPITPAMWDKVNREPTTRYALEVSDSRKTVLLRDAEGPPLAPPLGFALAGPMATALDGTLFALTMTPAGGDRRVHVLDPAEGTFTCVSDSPGQVVAPRSIGVGRGRVLLALHDGDESTIHLSNLDTGVDLVIGELPGSRVSILPLHDGNFFLGYRDESLHAFEIDGRTGEARRLADPLPKGKREPGPTILLDGRAVFMDGHIFSI